MVEVGTYLETSSDWYKIRDDANYRKGEMKANRSAKRYFFSHDRLLCSGQFGWPGRVAAVNGGIFY